MALAEEAQVVLSIGICMLVPALFVFGKADVLALGRLARLLVPTFLLLAVLGGYYAVTEPGKAAMFGFALLVPVAQILVYRLLAARFEDRYGRRPVSTFGEFSDQVVSRRAPDRAFSAAFFVASILLGAAVLVSAFWGHSTNRPG